MEMNNQNELAVLSDQELILKVKTLVKSERKIMHLVLMHIQEVATRKLYLKLGHTSLYQYLTQELGYAENAAYDRMQAVKILKHNPEVANQIQSGAINLSQLVKVSACLKHEKKEGRNVSGEAIGELLNRIENKTKFETEFVLAQTFDHVLEQNQKVKPQKDGSVLIQITLSKEQYDLFQEAQSLISHAVPDQNLADVITYLAKMQIQKKLGKVGFAEKRGIQQITPIQEKLLFQEQQPCDEILFCQDNLGPRKKNLSLQHETVTQSFVEKPFSRKVLVKKASVLKRKYISIHRKRIVMQNANGCCEFVNPLTNQKCGSKYQLQIDHKMPIAFGGGDVGENLRLLCGIHNRMEAEQMKLLL